MELLFYLSSIIIANLMVIKWGIVKWWILSFPAGAVAIGVTFSARDFVQRRYGKWGAWFWMLVATAITMFFNQTVAIASGTAFLISEGLDWFIYTVTDKPFHQRILLSNLLGCPLDSLIFVPMVFGWVWPAIVGQAIVKFVSSLIVLPFVWRRK